MTWQIRFDGGDVRKAWRLQEKERNVFLSDYLPKPILPKGVKLFSYEGERWILRFPPGTQGKLKKEGKEISFPLLRTQGEIPQEGGLEIFPVPEGVEEITLSFSGGTLIFLKEKAVKVAPPPSFSPAPVIREDRLFRWFFSGSLLFHIVLILILLSIHLPTPSYEDPTKIPERFAKLILPKKEPEKTVPAKEAPKKSLPTEAPPEEKPKEQEGGGGEKNKPPGPKSKEEIREKVMRKGVLAVLTARGKEGALADVLREGGVAGLETAISALGSGVALAQRGEDIRGPRGGGGGGRGVDIGALGAGEGRGSALGEKGRSVVRAQIETDEVETKGALNEEIIRAVVEKRLAAIRNCYEQELVKNPKLQGKVTIRFTIGEDGSVVSAEIENTTLNNPDVESCILRRIQYLKFPKPEKGQVTVSYPFVFTVSG
jgi:TonB family protein